MREWFLAGLFQQAQQVIALTVMGCMWAGCSELSATWGMVARNPNSDVQLQGREVLEALSSE
jgi:hypothetical protein